jgi:gas vesicle protein
MNTLLVAAAGLIAALLLAPKPGEEICGMVKEWFNSLRDKMMRAESTNGTGLNDRIYRQQLQSPVPHWAGYLGAFSDSEAALATTGGTTACSAFESVVA